MATPRTPRTRKSSLQVAKEVEEAAPENQEANLIEPMFEVALLFHTDKGVDRVDIGQISREQIQSVMSDVSNAFNTLRANSSFLLQDVQGNINFFNLDKVSRIEFTQKVVMS